MPVSSRKETRSGELQRKLQISLILMLVLVTGVIVATALVKASRVRHEAFSARIMQTTERAGTTVREFFAPVSASLRLLRRWGMSANGGDLDVQRVAEQFIPVLEEFSRVSGVVLADADGREYFVYRRGDGWLSRTLDAERHPGVAEWQRWQDLSAPVETWTGPIDYDPRLRPWFKGAVGPEHTDQIFWTPPYIFATAQEPGVTGAVSWATREAEPKTFVIALDVLLKQILEHTASIDVSEHGKAFLLDARGSLIGPPDMSPAPEGSPLMVAILHALQVWRADPDVAIRVAPIKSGVQTYWTGFRPVSADEQALWIGVVVPAQDLQAEIEARQYWLWGIAGATLLIGGVLATLIARYYGRHMRSMERRQSPRGDSEEEIRALIAQGEGEQLEFKSTMRFNLKAERPGKEIELAWLKGVVAFLNTEGGVVLIGVADDGAIVGLDHDDFANDDKCLLHFNNLVSQHIGQDLTQYISARVCTVGDKKILLVDCEPVPEPVFLKIKQDEEFYVRTGPRNAKLPVSKVLKYVKKRPG